MGKKKRQRKHQHAVRKSSEDRPEAEHPGVEEQEEDHPTEEPLKEEHTSEEGPTEEQPTEEQPTEEQPTEEQPTEEQPTEKHTSTEHSHEEHPIEEHPIEEHPIEEHPFEEHLLEPIEEHPDEEHSDAEHPDADYSDEEVTDEAMKKFLVKKYKALDLAANLVERTGQYDLAVICYDNSLKQKIHDYGEDAESTAYTRHCLGEMYLKIGMLDAAQEYILKALVTRLRIYLNNETDYIATWNAACSRSTTGRLLEARGKFDAAKEYRTNTQMKMSAIGKVLGKEDSVQKTPAEASVDNGKAEVSAGQVWEGSAISETAEVPLNEGQNDDTEPVSSTKKKKKKKSKPGSRARKRTKKASNEIHEAGLSTTAQEASCEPPNTAKEGSVVAQTGNDSLSPEGQKDDGNSKVIAAKDQGTKQAAEVNLCPEVPEDAGNSQTTTMKDKGTQTAEVISSFKDKNDDLSPHLQPLSRMKTENLEHLDTAGVRKGSSSPQGQNENDKAQTKHSEITVLEKLADVSIAAEQQKEDSGQRSQIPASSTPKTGKKAAKKQSPRKQPQQVNYQKWERRAKPKKKHPPGAKSQSSANASSSSAESQDHRTEPQMRNKSSVEETQPAEGQGDNTKTSALEPIVEELLPAGTRPTEGQDEDSKVAQEGGPVVTKVQPVGDQEESNSPQGEVVLSLEPLELTTDQGDTSKHQVEAPVEANSSPAEERVDNNNNEPQKEGLAVETAPPAPQQEDRAKRPKRPPVVIARTPVAPWNRPRNPDGSIPWEEGDDGAYVGYRVAKKPCPRPYQPPNIPHDPNLAQRRTTGSANTAYPPQHSAHGYPNTAPRPQYQASGYNNTAPTPQYSSGYPNNAYTPQYQTSGYNNTAPRPQYPSGYPNNAYAAEYQTSGYPNTAQTAHIKDPGALHFMEIPKVDLRHMERA
ncbi:hypothetical protein VP1G_01788 [Cytospora mali]|uniref:Uncharacterized protein n=1 Tax=Cytospora mali TaxID=578113 RepID=A0A194URM3_CYTMA|nr:hypothetical protein VP1G_01788 [Valsa mali var. pyri (nom. inval.)]